MSDFFSGAAVGASLGLGLMLAAGGLIVSTCTGHGYKHAHCKHIDSRAEYVKCYEEFGETK